MVILVGMERGTWTSERLDDLATGMRQGFQRVDQNFARVDRDIRDLRGDMNNGFQGLRDEINGLRAMTFRFQTAIIVALIGVMAAVLARGA